MDSNTFIRIYEAEIVDNTIVVKKIVILDESDKIIREATINKDMVNLLKNLQFSTKWHKVLTEFTIDTNPLELLK